MRVRTRKPTPLESERKQLPKKNQKKFFVVGQEAVTNRWDLNPGKSFLENIEATAFFRVRID